MIYCNNEDLGYILSKVPHMDDVYCTAIDIMALRGFLVTEIFDIELREDDLILHMNYAHNGVHLMTIFVLDFSEILKDPLGYCETRKQQEYWRQANDNHTSRRRFIRGDSVA